MSPNSIGVGGGIPNIIYWTMTEVILENVKYCNGGYIQSERQEIEVFSTEETMNLGQI